jgi:Transglutaminase-like superfamily
MPLVRTFLKHPKLFYQAGALLFAARMLVRVMPITRARHALSRVAAVAAPGASAGEADIGRIVWAFETVNRRLGFKCLPMALAAQALMNRYGHAVRLQIGVTRKNGSFSAHAWLESGEEIVLGGPPAFVADYSILRNLDELTV